MRQQQQRQEQDQQSRVIYELCSLLLSILRPSSPPPPPPQPSSHPLSYHPLQRRRPNPEVSPAAFASLFLGIALALMLCGSVTFVIGFILMPWVLGLIMVFYVVGFVANLSVLGRAILLGTAAGPAAPSANPTCTKELSGGACSS